MKRTQLLLCLSASMLLAGCRPVLFPNVSSSESTSNSEETPSSSEELPPEESSSSTPEEPKKDEGSKEEEKDIYDYEVSNKEEKINLSKYLKDNFTKSAANYYEGEFTKKVSIEDKPIIHTHEQLVDLLNKMAFYRIEVKAFKIDMTVSNGLSVKEELYLAYHDAYMCKDIVSLASMINEDEVGVILKYHDEVNTFSTIKPNKLNATYSSIPYLYDLDNSKERIDNIPYHGSSDLDVHNSDQLLYAILNGYNPIMKEDSPARKIYDKAISILKTIIYKDMSDNEKLLAISSYLTNNIEEDEEVYDICSYVSSSHNIDTSESTRLFRSFYLEGALLDKVATSHALSKASALFASLLNINVSLTGGKKHKVIKESISPIYYKDEDRNYFDSYMVCIVDNGSLGYGLLDPFFIYAGANTITSDTLFYRKRKMMVNTNNLPYYFDVNPSLDLSFFIYHDQAEFIDVDYISYMNTYLINNTNLAYDNDDYMKMYNGYAEFEEHIERYKEEFNITDKQFYYLPYYTDFDDSNYDENLDYMMAIYDNYYIDREDDTFPLYFGESMDDMNEYGFVALLYR